jgi:hypothetical protein
MKGTKKKHAKCKTTRRTLKKQRGGKAGMLKRVFDFTNSIPRGAGGYGIVVELPSKKVIKLLYDMNECEKLQNEASIQQKAYAILKKYVPEVKVPVIYSVHTQPVSYKNSKYLCGIEMENLIPPEGFNEQVHMLLGYHDNDIDEEWGKHIGTPVSELNPTRGFFASPETMEIIWENEHSNMTIESLAYLMGKACKVLLLHNILPIDLEWVWANKSPYIIDFGLCEIDSIDPYIFLNKKGIRGLKDDFYIPHEDDKGYEEFMKGFSFIINT